MSSLRVARLNMALAIAAAILAARSARAEPAAAPSSLISEQVLVIPFDGSNFGYVPTLMVGKDGNVYGTTIGTVFRIDAAGTLTTVHTFSEPRALPARLVVGKDGLLYGYTGQAALIEAPPGSPHGVFFRLDYQQNYTELLALPNTVATDLVVGSDAGFYAATAIQCYSEACADSPGVIKITSAGAYTLLGGVATYSQLSPIPMVVGSDGAIYGTRYDQNLLSQHSIFRLDTAGNITFIHTLTNTEGDVGNLTLGSDGLIYGTSGVSVSNSTGTAVGGTLIRFDNAGNVNLSHQFAAAATEGEYPTGSLALGTDGALYGVASNGGAGGAGTVYRVDTAGSLTALHSFNGLDGDEPAHGLVLAKDGGLYGVTRNSAFRADASGAVTYPGVPGCSPESSLVQGNDCALYGAGSQWNSATGTEEQVVYRLFEPGHLCQSISFDPLPDRTLGDPPFTVTATASSGLPVLFSVSGRCKLSGDQVLLRRGVGVCRVTAFQAGDSRFEPAVEVTQEFRVWPPRGISRLR